MAHCGGPRWGSARSTAAAPPGFPGYGIFEEDGYAQRTTFSNLPRQTAASNTRTSGERTPARVATKFSDKPVNLDDLSSFYDRLVYGQKIDKNAPPPNIRSRLERVIPA